MRAAPKRIANRLFFICNFDRAAGGVLRQKLQGMISIFQRDWIIVDSLSSSDHPFLVFPGLTIQRFNAPNEQPAVVQTSV